MGPHPRRENSFGLSWPYQIIQWRLRGRHTRAATELFNASYDVVPRDGRHNHRVWGSVGMVDENVLLVVFGISWWSIFSLAQWLDGNCFRLAI